MPLPPHELAELVEEARLENMPQETRGPAKARQSGRVGGYRGAFSAEEIELMNSIMRDNLLRYGYEID
jgi:hypothetical protein